MAVGSRHSRWAVALVAVAAIACGDSPSRPPEDGVDLNRLFATPTAQEIAAVEADWAARPRGAREVRTELTQPFGTAQLRVVSHVVDGNRHYGFVISPPGAPTASLPVVAYLHGGDAGVSLDEVLLAMGFAGIDPSTAVWVVPSFRSEPLRIGSQSWLSTGTPSPWDRDVDDTLGLIDAAAQLVPAADAHCIGALGVSRGGGVGLLLSARESRVRATVEFFGPTDFFGAFMREVAEETLRGQPRNLPGLTYLNQTWLEPLRQGQVTYAEARLALLRRSPARFASRLGPVQLHHGTADDVVPVSQAQALIDAMGRIGRGAPDFESYVYQGAGHNPLTMIGSPERVARFLGTLRARCAAAA